MSTTEFLVIELSDLMVGQTAVCFAILSSRETKTSKRNEPYFTCQFRAGQAMKVAQVWSNNACHSQVSAGETGKAYRIRVVGENRDKSYGSDLKLLEIEPAGPHHEDEGFNLDHLLAGSEIPKEKLWEDLRALVQTHVKDPCLFELLKILMREHRELFEVLPAAQNFHHAYNSGLLEHVWSLAKVCSLVADHYLAYYPKLNPPLNKDLIMVAAIVHDIGKLKELNYDLFDTTYTVPGQLLGHIVMGRDMVRDAAKRIPGFSEETLMLLEHAILAHHGKREFGSPVFPATLEALIVSFGDDLDAKMNAGVQALMATRPDNQAFTDRIKAFEGRTLYRGVPLENHERENFE